MPCQKPQQLGVGMAVCRQDEDYICDPIPTSLLYLISFCGLCTGKSTLKPQNRRDGVTCVVFVYHILPAYCHPVAVVFGTAIPKFLYIFENVRFVTTSSEATTNGDTRQVKNQDRHTKGESGLG